MPHGLRSEIDIEHQERLVGQLGRYPFTCRRFTHKFWRHPSTFSFLFFLLNSEFVPCTDKYYYELTV
jgi:hypothetical protein